MAKKAMTYEASEFLDNPEVVAEYITQALSQRKLDVFLHAVGQAAKAYGMSKLADETGLSRESLYRALTETGNPEFATLERVLTALGLKIVVEPAAANNKRAA
jgi:probable addiction module antidote protein